jgi:hypothetical protein
LRSPITRPGCGEEYIAAWRHVRERFERAGAHNAIWTWSPHVAYPYRETYYPAANSWIGSRPERLTTGRQDSSGQESWTFQEIFGTKYPQLASFGKPIMVAAFGSLAVAGVRAACFHAKDDQTITDQKFDCSIESNPALARTVAAAIRTWAPESAPQPREELSTRKQSAWTAMAWSWRSGVSGKP